MGDGYPENGPWGFTAHHGGASSTYKHFYIYTIYIFSGPAESASHDAETDRKAKGVVCGPGSSVVIPSLEPHGMRNLSDTEPATFLCCICNVYEKETV